MWIGIARRDIVSITWRENIRVCGLRASWNLSAVCVRLVEMRFRPRCWSGVVFWSHVVTSCSWPVPPALPAICTIFGLIAYSVSIHAILHCKLKKILFSLFISIRIFFAKGRKSLQVHEIGRFLSEKSDKGKTFPKRQTNIFSRFICARLLQLLQ